MARHGTRRLNCTTHGSPQPCVVQFSFCFCRAQRTECLRQHTKLRNFKRKQSREILSKIQSNPTPFECAVPQTRTGECLAFEVDNVPVLTRSCRRGQERPRCPAPPGRTSVSWVRKRTRQRTWENSVRFGPKTHRIIPEETRENNG